MSTLAPTGLVEAARVAVRSVVRYTHVPRWLIDEDEVVGRLLERVVAYDLLEKFQGPSLVTWLIPNARWCLFDHLRAEGRHREAPFSLYGFVRQTEAPMVDEAIDLALALGRLPVDDLALVEARANGERQQATARRLGTDKYQVCRAQKRIERELREAVA